MRFLFELASDDVFISHLLDVVIKVFWYECLYPWLLIELSFSRAEPRLGENELLFLKPSGNPIHEQSVSDLHNRAWANRTWYVAALRRADLPRCLRMI
ncbi:MAG: hypothetical protein ABF545_02395 [Bifidobacterium psychraerophilum]|uniref:hypothetical protein n=1 Tax=Bifidobacterium psychraerophilum TaxID=218140 RepID=UPI0039ED8F26